MQKHTGDLIVIRLRELDGDVQALAKAFGVAPKAIYRYLEGQGLGSEALEPAPAGGSWPEP